MNGSVCVLYGLGEGTAIGKELISKLQKNGFEITNDASRADYIIAHSGGMLYIPKIYRAKVFLLIGVNNKIDGSVILTQYRKIKQDFVHAISSKRHWYWLKKSFWNLFYLLREINKTLHMWQIAHGEESFIPSIENAKVTVVNYKDDPWSGSLLKKDLEKFPRYELITRTGLHDDLWINPEFYINLLQTSNM